MYQNGHGFFNWLYEAASGRINITYSNIAEGPCCFAVGCVGPSLLARRLESIEETMYHVLEHHVDHLHLFDLQRALNCYYYAEEWF